MSLEYYDTLHRTRADQLEQEAATVAATRKLRRARRLEVTARTLDKLARRLEAQAGRSRARLL